MWTYKNPVGIMFGNGQFSTLVDMIAGRSYALVTYPDGPFDDLTVDMIAEAGQPELIINDIAPNPDTRLLAVQSARFADLAEMPDVIVALGGGSVIDSAKVFATAGGDFSKVLHFLQFSLV